MSDLENQGQSGAPAPELTTQERVVLGHLQQLRTSQEMAASMRISHESARALVRATLQEMGPRRLGG